MWDVTLISCQPSERSMYCSNNDKFFSLNKRALSCKRFKFEILQMRFNRKQQILKIISFECQNVRTDVDVKICCRDITMNNRKLSLRQYCFFFV